MSFLRLGALWMLPLILLPVAIHLIHRRRHPTMQWAAMMFLHRATQASRGPAKIRRWLILAARMVVIAGLVLAFARPLSNGRFGLAASRVANPAATIVVLDRSPSMRTRLSDGRTRLEAAKSMLVDSLRTLGVANVVLIESVSESATPAIAVESLLSASATEAADSSASIPKLFSVAIEAIRENDFPSVDVWVCSDRQVLDWKPESSEWISVSEQLNELESEVRFYGIEFPDKSLPNTSVAVTEQKIAIADKKGGSAERGTELLLTVQVQCDQGGDRMVPVQVIADGVTTEAEVSLVDGMGVTSGIIVPIEEAGVVGRVSIAADVNVADDQFFFAASATSKGRIALISDESSDALDVVVRVFDGDFGREPGSVESYRGLDGIVALGIPREESRREEMLEFVEQGGSLLCFPGSDLNESGLVEGVQWKRWVERDGSEATMDGLDFKVDRFAPLTGELVRVAETNDGQLLVGNRRVGSGMVWFCGCDVMSNGGAFVGDGVILYGLLSEIVGSETRDRDVVGEVAGDLDLIDTLGNDFDLIDGFSDTTVERGHRAGIYQRGDLDSERTLVAINPALAESSSPKISENRVRELLPHSTWTSIAVGEVDAASGGSLVREIWGSVWVAVILAMLFEAWLSLPQRRFGSQFRSKSKPGVQQSGIPQAGSVG